MQSSPGRIEQAGLETPLMLVHNLAGLANARGRFVEAERHAREGVARWRACGERDFGLAVDLCGLGDSLAGQGKLVDAERAYREALEIFLASQRPEHPEVAYCLHNLADVLADQRRFTEAEKAYRESIRRKRASLGEEHFEVAASMNNLAALLFQARRVSEARVLAKRATKMVRATLPAQHPVRVGCEQMSSSIGA
jgi:tetratricopeptide (TPR) repeat protein